MPRFDGTGPQGKGPMTGRGLGKCNPKNNQNTPGRGLGNGTPKRDGTGPQGQGPRTGRGLGNCAPESNK